MVTAACTQSAFGGATAFPEGVGLYSEMRGQECAPASSVAGDDAGNHVAREQTVLKRRRGDFLSVTILAQPMARVTRCRETGF